MRFLYAIPFVMLLLPPDEANAAWELSSSESHCAVTGKYDDDGDTLVSFAQRGEDDFVLLVANDNWTIVEGRPYPLQYLFDNRLFNGEAKGFQDNGLKGFSIGGGSDFADVFAKSKTLAILKENNSIVVIVGLHGSSVALSEVRSCWKAVSARRDRERLASEALAAKRAIIPADPFFDASEAVPIGNAATWATNDDYPARAQREEREGSTGYRVRVGADGKVLSCEVTSSSGHADLDQETCKAVARRARFNAIPEGSPVRMYSQTMKWRIPRE